jgi:hypothetical protein
LGGVDPGCPLIGMNCYAKIAGLLLILLTLIAILIIWWDSAQSPDSPDASTPTHAENMTIQAVGLPGRATDTPDNVSPLALPTAPRTPVVTSPFTFPPSLATIIPTPMQACTRVFPLDSVEAIEFGVTTITQLEAAFGRAQYQGGRAPRFRFEEGDCVLIVTVGIDEALAAELPNYGTFDLLLDCYGEPGAVGISQGNLTLLDVGNAVLLYPEAGIIAIFDVAPDDLTRSTAIASLQFRSPYEIDQQLRRLNLRRVDQ